MLGKLIKNDFKSLSRILLPTQLAILGATLIASLGFTFNMRTNIGNIENTGMQILRIITGIMSGIMVLAIFAAAFLVAFIIFYRFYKSCMCDEGYLTFTLPVTTGRILWSKFITAMLWTLISAVVVIICGFLFMIIGTADHGIINTEMLSDMSRIFGEVGGMFGGRIAFPIFEAVVMILLGIAFGIFHVFLSLIIGGVISKKHKLLAGIGFYFIINIVVGVLSSVGQVLVGSAYVNSVNSVSGIAVPLSNVQVFDLLVSGAQPFVIYYMVLTIAMTALFFALSHYFLKNKLNLE
ncbi:MAG: hypothetical protein RR227_03750 [Oscillospiraceae bacterium]